MKTEDRFFVMLTTQDGFAVPMADPEGSVYFCETKEEAEEKARHSFYGENFGFEVFELGQGC